MKKLLFIGNKIYIEYQVGENSIVEDLSKSEFKFVEVLNCEIEFGKNLTIENLFECLKSNFEYIDYIFQSFTNKHRIEPFYYEMKNTPDEDFSNYNHIEFYRHIEDYDGNIEESQGFHAVSDNKNNIPYVLTYDSIKNWKHFIIKLRKEYSIIKLDESIMEYKTVFLSNKEYTLFEFLSGFLSELMRLGHPEDIFECSKDIIRSIGNIEIISISQYKIDNLEKELKEFIEKEEYEKAEEVKEKLKKLKDQTKR